MLMAIFEFGIGMTWCSIGSIYLSNTKEKFLGVLDIIIGAAYIGLSLCYALR